jgi:biopolymer transport protein ExbB
MMMAPGHIGPQHRRRSGLLSRRRSGPNRLTALLLGLVGMMALDATPAGAWWNDDWQLREKITIDASMSGADITDPIDGAPVLVRLHLGNFRFGAAKDDGSDLRFVAEDDKTPLKFHIDKYDSLLDEALIWVAVPNLKPGAKTEFWMYSGNKKAAAASDAKATYDADMLLVYHFNERGAPALDSTLWANNAQSVGQLADGAIIGSGLSLDGGAPLTLPATPSLAISANAAWTWSAWIKPAAPQPNAALYSRRDNADGVVIGIDNGTPFVEVSHAGTVQRSGAGAPIDTGWHHLAMVASGAQITLYLDGASYASLSATLPALSTIALIGGDSQAQAAPASTPAAPGTKPEAEASTPSAVAAMAGFVGEIDELQIAKVARPAGWLKLAAIGQGADQAKLISFSVNEETGSWLTGYFAVILKSVTLDGWVVIGFLMVMAVLSWGVMFNRVSYLNAQSRANTRFIKSFREVGDLSLLGHGDAGDFATLGGRIGAAELKQLRLSSSLYRIFTIGAAEIQHRFGQASERRRVLSSTSIAAIRATLDAGFIKESQRLNRLMVILTIAISGGPFLGLLGTVVGVMITFAAIAASGDVNVNAIAPGIAAALVATVAGLVVAIPALFGYNYLISRIKDLSNDIQVFIDEFVTKLAEFYAADRPDRVGQCIAAE